MEWIGLKFMTDTNFENKIEHWYESKIAFMISILVPVVIILGFLYDMRTDIALTRQDVASIKDSLAQHEKSTVDITDKVSILERNQSIVLNKLNIKSVTQ